MNFLAMATLKKERACLRLPSSMRPLRSLKFTFDSERMGIAMVGSFRRSAASITMSATPTSFFSTAVGFLGFLAMAFYFFFFLRRPARGSGVTVLDLALVARAGLVCGAVGAGP